MRRMMKMVFAAGLFTAVAVSACYCETVMIDKFIKEYDQATGLQRAQMDSDYKYKVISVSGTIENVESWEIFDEKDQIKVQYYRVNTQAQAISQMNSYAVSIFYKDMASVEKLDRGQAITVDGALLKIVVTPGSFAVWVYAGDLTDQDKIMFEQ